MFPKGGHHSNETKQKMSLSGKGRVLSKEHKQKISTALTGRSFSEEHRRNITKANTGRQPSLETKIKNSKSNSGKNHYNWRGGITPINHEIRRGIEYRLWRESVFARDGWTCCGCGRVGGVIHAHHIHPFSQFPELRFAIDNGLTLCKKCHELRKK